MSLKACFATGSFDPKLIEKLTTQINSHIFCSLFILYHHLLIFSMSFQIYIPFNYRFNHHYYHDRILLYSHHRRHSISWRSCCPFFPDRIPHTPWGYDNRLSVDFCFHFLTPFPLRYSRTYHIPPHIHNSAFTPNLKKLEQTSWLPQVWQPKTENFRDILFLHFTAANLEECE